MKVMHHACPWEVVCVGYAADDVVSGGWVVQKRNLLAVAGIELLGTISVAEQGA